MAYVDDDKIEDKIKKKKRTLNAFLIASRPFGYDHISCLRCLRMGSRSNKTRSPKQWTVGEEQFATWREVMSSSGCAGGFSSKGVKENRLVKS